MKEKNTFLLIMTFIVLNHTEIQSQQINVDALYDGYHEMEYGCITQDYYYEIDFYGYKVSNLVYNVTYNVGTTQPAIFDNMGYQSKSYYFDLIFDDEWKWTSSSITTDTIILEASGAYQNLVLGSSQWFTFAASALGHGSDYINVNISVVTSMTIDWTVP